MKSALFAALLALLSLFSAHAHAQELDVDGSVAAAKPSGPPKVMSMRQAASRNLDLRRLPSSPPKKRIRPERGEPARHSIALNGARPGVPPSATAPRAPAPAPIANFLGLDFTNWGAGRPPDPVGDVGPTHYIQAVNSSIAIYRKSDNVRVAAFTFDTFMSQGNFGNLCDTDNFGDPVVLYDTFEDRWVISDFAFQLDGGGNVVNPPGAFQCFAVSRTGDPITGGWNFYSLQMPDALNDYPKLGIWPDGIYMSANMFAFPSGGGFQGARVWALNKAQMYAGAPVIQIVQFNAPSVEFTLLPANARLQTGTPPAGSPNYFSVLWQYVNAISFYKFHVDWDRVALSSFTGPFITLAPASWQAPPNNAPALGGNALDTLPIRLMMQNQYTHIGGVESLWNVHTVRHPTTAGIAAVRYYETSVTGGTVATNVTQAATHAPDTTHRYMPSLAVDRAGDLAIGYSASSTTLAPAIRYAGRLASDPLNTLAQTETSLVEGTGAQAASARWGDYSSMTLDPDGCTFWYTNEYYVANGNDWQTRVGSFQYPSCTAAGAGALQGTVTALAGGAPIAGATVQLGSRTTTTNASGFYAFATLPSGLYPAESVSASGFNPASASDITVSDGATTTRDFALAATAASACLIDTTRSDFLTGTPVNVDLDTSPDDVILLDAATIDQQNTTLSTSGVGITTTTWGGQTFTAAVTGELTQIDVNLFCSGCTGTFPNLTVSLRATAANLPTGADIASATIAGFNSGAAGYFTGVFAAPPTLTAGTVYALVVRPTANPAPGTYALTRSPNNVYAAGQRVSSTNTGVTWSAPLTAGQTTDAGFRIYINDGFAPAGDLIGSLKDINPAAGYTPTWTTLSWTGTTPANTTLNFQAAASNSASGPFNFVGPDGTAATFFSSGAALTQFNGNRYLKYRSFLTTTVGTATPTLNDVTVCYAALPTLTLDDVSHVEGGSGTTTHSFTASLSAPAGSGGVSFDIASADGSAIEPGDYTANALTGAIIPAGSSSLTFDVLANGDTSVETDENFVVNISNLANAIAGDVQGAGSIVNDDFPADLAVTMGDNPDPVIAGGNITYAIGIANNGPGVATSASWNTVLPAGTAFVSLASPGGWSCTAPAIGAGGTVSCSLPSFAIDSAAFTLIVAVDAGIAAGTVLSATAAATSATPDPAPGNESATATTTVVGSADLSLTASDSPDPVLAGNNLSYTLTAANAGPSTAASVTLAGTLPAGTTFVSLATPGGWSCTTPAVGAGGMLSCSLASMSSGNAVFTLVVAVDAAQAAGSVLSYTATVASTTSDPNPGNESGNTSTTVGAAADLSASVSDTPDPVTAGTQLSYAISVSNAGPSTATNAALTDTLPAGVSFVSLASAAGWSCTTPAVGASGTVSCSAPAMAPGNALHTLVVAVDAGVASGTVISNTATVSSTTSDPDLGNQSGSASTTVGVGSADMSVTLTDAPDPVIPGSNLTYTINASNAGPGGAISAALASTLPAGTRFVSLAAPGGWSCTTPAVGATGTVNCTLATMAPGTATFSLVVGVDAALSAGTVISNSAMVSSATADPNPGNENAVATTTVAPPSADVSVTQTDAPDPVAPGSNITYAINVGNAGPSDAATLSLSDTLAAGTTFVSLASPAGWSCTTPAVGAAGTVNCARTVLAPGSEMFTLVVATDAGLSVGTVISNTATVSSLSADPNTGNESASVTTTIGSGSADLSLTQTDAPDPVAPGGNLTYTMTLTNAGPSAATSASLSDTLAAGTTFVSLAAPGGWSCTTPAVGATGTVSCTHPSQAIGNAAFTLVVNVGAAVVPGTLVSNTASASSTTTDPDSGDNSATATTTVSGGAVVSGTKTVAGGNVVGATITYTVTLTNTGNAAQGDNAGNEMIDVLPATLALVSASASSGSASVTLASNTVAWNGAIPAAGSVTITITATILPAAAGVSIANQATMAFDADGNGSNESSAQSDDPAIAGAGNPTILLVALGQAIEVPALSILGLFLMMGLLLPIAYRWQRR